MKVLKKIIKWLLIILVVLLAVLGTAAYMGYKYLNNDPWANCYDDVNSMELYDTVTTKDLMAYDRSNYNLTLTIDKRTLYSLYKIDKFNEGLAQYDVKITNVGIKLLEQSKEFEVYVELYYKDKIPAHIWAKGDIEYEDLKFNFVVKEGKLGEKYDIDLNMIKEYIGINDFSLSYEIDDHPVEICFPYKSYDRSFLDLTEITEDKMVISANAKQMIQQYELDRYNALGKKAQKNYVYGFKNFEAALDYASKVTLQLINSLMP